MGPMEIKFTIKVQDITLSHAVIQMCGSKVFISGMSLAESQTFKD